MASNSANEPHDRVANESELERAMRSTMEFDYGSPAELFMPKRRGGGRQQRMNYRRFTTAAEAVRFAVEEFPAVKTLGAWMQVGDQRYDSDAICRLYERSGYPLHRATS